MDTWQTNDVGDDWEFERQHQWFAERPVIPVTQSAPSEPEPKIQPSDSALASNGAIVYALQIAPNILRTRYDAFGELGVLGWCDEFRELIDAIIETGFEGALFTSTRETALTTCTQLLRLDINIKMQIIVIYLSAQVARLRRFLDGDLQYEDYPDLQFPKAGAGA